MKTKHKENSFKYICILIALPIFASMANAQDLPGSGSRPVITDPVTGKLIISGQIGSSTGCDTCKYNLFNTTWSILNTYPHSTYFYYDNAIKMKISPVDSNGQQTGWFDKRYVKMTSDSTFVILPKTK